MSVDRIGAVLGYYGNVVTSLKDSSVQGVYPEINFTCAGSILSWTFGASWEGNTPGLTELQIWRNSGDGSYTKVGSTTIMTEENTTGLYQYPLSSPLPFQARDILGYYQPARSRSQLGLVYENVGSGQPAYYVTRLDNAPSLFTATELTLDDRYHVLVGVETGNLKGLHIFIEVLYMVIHYNCTLNKTLQVVGVVS